MWLHIPSAGHHVLPSEDLKKGKTWLLRASARNPASFTCSVSLQIPQLQWACGQSVPMTKIAKMVNRAQFFSTGATGLPWVQSMNRKCSLHHAGNTIFTLFMWTVAGGKQGFKVCRERHDVSQQLISRKH